jgi:hypothetical protein
MCDIHVYALLLPSKLPPRHVPRHAEIASLLHLQCRATDEKDFQSEWRTLNKTFAIPFHLFYFCISRFIA